MNLPFFLHLLISIFALLNCCDSKHGLNEVGNLGGARAFVESEIVSTDDLYHGSRRADELANHSRYYDRALVRQKRGVISYFKIKSHVKGLGMYIIVMDVVFYPNNEQWECNLEGLAYVLDMGQRSLTDNLYYYSKLLVLMKYTLKDIAYLLEAYPATDYLVLKDLPTDKVDNAHKKIEIQDDAYFSSQRIMSVKGMQDLLVGSKPLIVLNMNGTSSKPADIYLVRPTGTLIAIVWGEAMYNEYGHWIMINNDKEMIRTYNGLGWLANAYRTLQSKYNALLFYICPQPMQLHGSIKYYLATKNFPTTAPYCYFNAL